MRRPGRTGAYRPQQLEVRTRRAPKAPLWAKSCLSVGVALVLVAALAGGGLWFTGRYDDNVRRENLLPAANAQAGDRSGPIRGPLNILVLGSDDRTAAANDRAAERGDTILLLHIGPGLDRGYGVSFPRDSLVDLPAYGGFPAKKAKINRAYAEGGPPRLVKAVEKLSGLRVDHVLTVDFGGLRAITDAVGGVDVYIDAETRDPYRPDRVFKQGVNHLDGQSAIAYVRQRKGLADGDYDRVKRQQQFLHALLEKVSSTGAVTDVGKLDDLLMAVTSAVTVDQTMRVRDMALALRSLKPATLSFLTLPMMAAQKIEGTEYEIPDGAMAAELFKSLKAESMDEYLELNPPNEVTHGA